MRIPRLTHGCSVVAVMCFAAVAAGQGAPLTLELIMQDPDWIGNSPQGVYWSDDGEAVYYELKRVGSPLRDLYRVTLDGETVLIADEDLGDAHERGGDWSQDRSRKVFSRNGDVFLSMVESGDVIQLTRTNSAESSPFFMDDETFIAFRRGGDWFVRDLATGLEYQPFEVRATKDPDEDDKKDHGYVDAQQERLFDIIKKREREDEERKSRQEELRLADATRADKPWYLGDKVVIAGTDLSPRGDAMLVRTTPKSHKDGKRDLMPVWVNEEGYVENREVRTLVGTGEPEPHSVLLLKADGRETIAIDFTKLPMIDDDPLAELRAIADAKKKEAAEKAKLEKEADTEVSSDDESSDAEVETSSDSSNGDDESADEKKDEKKSKPHKRTVSTFGVQWNDAGTKVAFWARANDNKDRWLCVVDVESGELTVAEHLRDEAWINWAFNQFGWMPDNESLWLLSERTGYSHLYLASADGESLRALTEGDWEVRDVTRSHDGSRLWISASREHPGRDDLYEIDVASGDMARLSSLVGRNRFEISPDEEHVLVTHSSPLSPPDVYVQPLIPGGRATRLTSTVSEEFLAIEWAEPELVEVASSNSEQPIFARVYTPDEDAPGADADGRRPAVMFVHGAGYLQNAHFGWSTYFREFMFHSLLTQLGYVVIDMDYRASAGYGRDWRTAIYRRMGEPELEDFIDGVDWLIANKNVDPDRIGVYGGSYGGFMTFMALFREPDLFACGAALRPVTDWAHYNHGYTSNILNTPDIDPEAYERSSPIEFAGGLSSPVLICHGMVDDNVFFKDTVRLAQRLIELQKEDWEVAIYPVEPHGFREPSSWLDEYRRILKLFEENLKD